MGLSIVFVLSMKFLNKLFIYRWISVLVHCMHNFLHIFTRVVGDLIKRHIPCTNSIHSRHTHAWTDRPYVGICSPADFASTLTWQDATVRERFEGFFLWPTAAVNKTDHRRDLIPSRTIVSHVNRLWLKRVGIPHSIPFPYGIVLYLLLPYYLLLYSTWIIKGSWPFLWMVSVRLVFVLRSAEWIKWCDDS